mmetsp:Transcript_31765/g.62906  ORF Transcript_31765/g.62906 Transcript_31765/m.62906 type:complete len:103 (-) Transcript_31765:1718-2026(-)
MRIEHAAAAETAAKAKSDNTPQRIEKEQHATTFSHTTSKCIYDNALSSVLMSDLLSDVYVITSLPSEDDPPLLFISSNSSTVSSHRLLPPALLFSMTLISTL